MMQRQMYMSSCFFYNIHHPEKFEVNTLYTIVFINSHTSQRWKTFKFAN